MRQGVPAQDVEVHADRTQPVGRVQIAVARQVVLEAPLVFVVGGVEHQGAQVVQVGTFGVGHRAEDTVLDHVEQPQFFAVVAAVFQHDAMPLRFLGYLDQFYAGLRRVSDGHFRRCVHAAAHGCDRHRRVQFPRGADQGHVRHIVRHGLHPSVRRSGEDPGHGLLEFGDLLLGAADFGRVDVADGRDFGVAFLHEPIQHVNEALASVAQSEDRNAHPRDGGDGEVKGTASEAGGFDFGGEDFIQRSRISGSGKRTQHSSEPKQATHPKKIESAHVPKIGKAAPYAFNS